MAKILGQSGNSLADIYDVQGSIAGIERLESEDLFVVHELGATVFSERYSTQIRHISTGSLLQNIDFNVIDTSISGTPARLLAVAVHATFGVRVLRAAVHVHDVALSRDCPVWIYDGASFINTLIDDGTGPVTRDMLLGNIQASMLPSMVAGDDQPQTVEALALRGRTTAFGAGDVTIHAHYYVAFSQVAGLDSRGLPIPSW